MATSLALAGYQILSAKNTKDDGGSESGNEKFTSAQKITYALNYLKTNNLFHFRQITSAN